MVNYVQTWSDFRQANPEFGEDQFDEVLGRITGDVLAGHG